MEPLVFNFLYPVKRSILWEWLIKPELMKRWMLEETNSLEILSDFAEGKKILFKGDLHGIAFENHGSILSFEPQRKFSYSHKSSLSKLADMPANYCILCFELSDDSDQTRLVLKIDNFPTFEIYKHMQFYWPAALTVLRHIVNG